MYSLLVLFLRGQLWLIILAFLAEGVFLLCPSTLDSNPLFYLFLLPNCNLQMERAKEQHHLSEFQHIASAVPNSCRLFQSFAAFFP